MRKRLEFFLRIVDTARVSSAPGKRPTAFGINQPERESAMSNLLLKRHLAVIALIATTLGGCGIDDALSIIEDAIARLERESANWRLVVEETRDELIEAGQSTIANEVSNTLQRAIDASGTEFSCRYDFVRRRVQQDLVAIKASLLGEEVPPKEPEFCNANPPIVAADLVPDRLGALELYGYDFDATAIQVLLEDAGRLVDITECCLDSPSHYLLTVNLGSNGAPITPDSQRFILRWRNTDRSSVGISQPSAPKLPILYEITLRTGCLSPTYPGTVSMFGYQLDDAGTDAGVYITLYGSDGIRREIGLDTADHDDREACQTDIYRISASEDKGDILRIRIRHDNTGAFPSWYLESLAVRNVSSGQEWLFPCNRWLSVHEGDRQIVREIAPGGPCQ